MRVQRLHLYLSLLISSLLMICVFAPKALKNIFGNKESPNNGNLIYLPESQIKTILLWTTFFGDKNFIKPMKSLGCSETRCQVTADRSMLYRSDAIVFHHTDINPYDVPKTRHPRQRWVYLNHESPDNNRVSVIAGLEDKFNWTITYRLDSDMFLTPVVHPLETTLTTDQTDFSKDKNKMAAWFVSHCDTKGNREGYVKELQKFFPVDIYGGCGTKKCMPKMSEQCYKRVAKEYSFYLSFENSICKDYVTEKFINILSYDVVPVVFGGGDYKIVAPPGSYINALDFKSPKELAEYLKNVSMSSIEYNKFFEWRKNYRITINPYGCQLCAKLHDPKEPRHKNVNDLKKWWFDKAKCWRWNPQA